MENINNIVAMCKSCAEERRINFQKEFNKSTLKVGQLIKKEFKQGKLTEHMWVLITKITNKEVIGKLDNEPVALSNVKFGQEVKVKFSEIEDLM